jgi:hypothetical protein
MASARQWAFRAALFGDLSGCSPHDALPGATASAVEVTVILLQRGGFIAIFKRTQPTAQAA